MTRMTRLAAARVGLTAVLAVSGSAAPVAAGSVVSDAPGAASGTPATAAATAAEQVAGQVADGATAEQVTVPDVLVADLGYRPVVEDGYLVNPDGACSSPVALPTSFTPACRAHDLGYDLLRVIDRDGRAVPAGLRRDLDDRLVDRASGTCGAGMGGSGCRLVARGVAAALWLNTQRQGEGAPVAEHFPWSF
jgi:hypothetical protein